MSQAISVIIPTLNEEERIGTLLEKLTKIDDIEIIVSDGGSRDNTVQLCTKYHVLTVQSEKGRGIQLNTGAAHAQGEILLFLHADTDLGADIFAQLNTVLSTEHIWGCCTLLFENQSLFYRIIGLFSNIRAKCFSICYGDQGIYCRREVFAKEGGFASLPLMEDLEFSHRMKKRQKAHVLPGYVITSTRRFREGGPVKTICKMQVLKLLYKLGVDPVILNRWYRRKPGEKL